MWRIPSSDSRSATLSASASLVTVVTILRSSDMPELGKRHAWLGHCLADDRAPAYANRTPRRGSRCASRRADNRLHCRGWHTSTCTERTRHTQSRRGCRVDSRGRWVCFKEHWDPNWTSAPAQPRPEIHRRPGNTGLLLIGETGPEPRRRQARSRLRRRLTPDSTATAARQTERYWNPGPYRRTCHPTKKPRRSVTVQVVLGGVMGWRRLGSRDRVRRGW